MSSRGLRALTLALLEGVCGVLGRRPVVACSVQIAVDCCRKSAHLLMSVPHMGRQLQAPVPEMEPYIAQVELRGGAPSALC